MKHCYTFIIILQLFFFNNSIAQHDSPSIRSFTKFNINYLSNSVYFGRKDSSTTPYLRSSISYFDRSGFYISAGMALLIKTNTPVRLDLFNIDAGYKFTINQFDAGVYASKFFYSKASYAVASEIKGLSGFYLNYNQSIISVGGGGYILFSPATDFGTYINLSHTFEKEKENSYWSFAPSIQLNAGTQYFNEAYYEFRKFPFPTTAGNNGKNKGKGHAHSSNNGNINTPVKTVTFYNQKQFKILDLELSLPINYEKNYWGLYAIPTVAFPTNAAEYAIDNSLQKESLAPVFFTEIGAYIKF